MTINSDVERLALLGWRLHPVSRSSRAACFKGANAAASYDLDMLERWSDQYPGCNWAAIMEGSGIWGLDLDVPGGNHAHDGVAAFAALVAVHGPVPPRPMIRTGGSGGLALLFRHQGEPIIGATGSPAPGIDPRRGRQAIAVPPSIHHRTGLPYTWIAPPWEIAPPIAPAWLLRLVTPPPEPPLRAPRPLDASQRPYAVGALRKAVERVASAVPGQRNDTLNREAWSVARFVGVLQPSEIAEALSHAGRVAGLDQREVSRTIMSAMSAGAKQ